jgi:hypothetical protein
MALQYQKAHPWPRLKRCIIDGRVIPHSTHGYLDYFQTKRNRHDSPRCAWGGFQTFRFQVFEGTRFQKDRANITGEHANVMWEVLNQATTPKLDPAHKK